MDLKLFVKGATSLAKLAWAIASWIWLKSISILRYLVTMSWVRILFFASSTASLLTILSYVGVGPFSLFAEKLENSVRFTEDMIEGNGSKFLEFLLDNDDKSVYINTCLIHNNKLIESISNDNIFALQLTLKDDNGDGTIVSIERSVLANGHYCIKDYFRVYLVPGIHQGWTNISLNIVPLAR